MKKKKFFSTVDPPPRYFEKYDGVSITQQDPGLSIREIYENYVLTGEVPPTHPVYFDVVDPDDPDADDGIIKSGDFDLSDITDARNRVELAKSKEKEAKEALDKAKQRKKASSKKESLKGNVDEGEDEEGGTTDKDDDRDDVPGDSQAFAKRKP